MDAGRRTARDRNGFEGILVAGHVGPHVASRVIRSWVDEPTPPTEKESAGVLAEEATTATPDQPHGPD